MILRFGVDNFLAMIHVCEYMLNDSSLSQILMILRFQVWINSRLLRFNRFQVWIVDSRLLCFNRFLVVASWLMVMRLRCIRESMLQWCVTDTNDFILRHASQLQSAALLGANVWVYYVQWYMPQTLMILPFRLLAGSHTDAGSFDRQSGGLGLGQRASTGLTTGFEIHLTRLETW